MRVFRLAVSVRLALLLVLLGSLVGELALPVAAQEEPASDEFLVLSDESNAQPDDLSPELPIASAEVPQLSELEQPATTVEDWVAQIEASLVQVTDVRVEATEAGLQVILETEDGVLEVPETRSVGNALIADISNATIAEEFSQAEPIEGIALVSVTSLPGDRVRVAITGTNAPPVAEVTSEAQGLVLAVTLGDVGTTAEEDAIQVVVTGEQDEGYNPSNATTATRTDTPLRDVPASITVVPQQVLDDRNVRDITEAVETVSGVLDNQGFLGTPGVGTRIIRGFEQTGADGGSATLRNGFRDLGSFGLTAIGTIEQVEVLRGPASVLFGALEPGGVINVITRQPLDEPYYNLAFEAGNYGFYQPSIDFSGPLTEDDTVLYRFIASYQGAENVQDFVNTELLSVSPSITLNLGDRTTLNLYYEYLKALVDSSELPGRLSDGSITFPRDFYPGYPQFNSIEAITQRYGYTLSHEFSDNLQLRNTFAVNNSDYRDQRSIGSELVDDRFLVIGDSSDAEFSWNSYFAQIDLLGEFNTGSIAHQLLLGFDYSYVNNAQEGAISATNTPNLDIFDPNYDDIPEPVYDIPFFENQDTIESYGIYLQNQISLLDNLKLLVGGRFDWVSSIGEGDFRPGRTNNNSAFSPRIGLVYQPSDTVSLYASYSRSFQPPRVFSLFNAGGEGEPFEPTRGTQYEVGVKTDFLDGRLLATLAAYQITRTNVTTPDLDPARAARGFSVQVGEQRSQGIELDVTGEILPGWSVIASYAHTDAEVTEDNSIPVGNRLRGVPENQASLWTTYIIQDGDLAGLGFGLGLFYVGDRQGNLQNSFTLGDYFRTDAALYYRRDRFNAAINIRNLFDVTYFNAGLFRGDPFTITGSISWTF
jgi:iron complex outermembrane recepter protein